MATKLINEYEYRGCNISFFEQWNPHDYDGISYFYEIVDRQGDSRTDQTDEYPLGSLAHAERNAIKSIDEDLDKWYAISCLATNRNKCEHFALSFYGELDGAIEAGLKELTKLYPEWKYSVKACQLN
jgi:hypothetical protein